MALVASDDQGRGRHVRANGIDISIMEAGQGDPLLLLHGGIVSTNPIWAGTPVAYVSHMETFAQHFRVIAPDTRGCGRTVNPGGAVSYTQLADDVVALMDALDLERSLLCGFSDGAVSATLVGIRQPDRVRALVNHAGYDLFNPQAHSHTMMRMVMGGSPDAIRANPDALARFFDASDEMRGMFRLMQADIDDAQGSGYWKTHIADVFDRVTTSPGYTLEDLRTITAPTLILTGDRDHFCSVEEGVAAFRMLQNGALAVLPNLGHMITPPVVQATCAYLLACCAAERARAAA